MGMELRDTLLVLRPGPRAGFAFLFRTPLSEQGVTTQILATATGGLNIDACRVPSGGEHFRSTVKGRGGGMLLGDPREGASLGMFQANATFEPTNHPGGRWPPNVLLVHAAACVGQLDGDVVTWNCVVPCPVMILDAIDAERNSRFYPQFADEEGLMSWLHKLTSGGLLFRDSV